MVAALAAAAIPLIAAAVPAIANAFSSNGASSPTRAPGPTPTNPAPSPGMPPAMITQSGTVVGPAQAQVGRAVVSRTNAELHPALQQILAGQAQRATQIQATAEHRNIVARQAWRDDVVRRLQRVENYTMPHGGATRGVNRTLRY